MRPSPTAAAASSVSDTLTSMSDMLTSVSDTLISSSPTAAAAASGSLGSVFSPSTSGGVGASGEPPADPPAAPAELISEVV